MYDISALKNAFSTTFGLSGEMHYSTERKGKEIITTLELSVDEFHQKYISKEEAMEIFDCVTKAFMIGCKAEHHYSAHTYEFDRENLTVVETTTLDAPHRGEWL